MSMAVSATTSIALRAAGWAPGDRVANELLDALNRDALHIALCGQQLVQQVIQPAPGGQHLRHVDAHLGTALSAQGHALAKRHAQRIVDVQAGALQAGKQSVMRDDAGTAAVHRDPYFFKHAHIVFLAVQDIGSQQPAQRTADDENP
jgi:hypothetical protein